MVAGEVAVDDDVGGAAAAGIGDAEPEPVVHACDDLLGGFADGEEVDWGGAGLGVVEGDGGLGGGDDFGVGGEGWAVGAGHGAGPAEAGGGGDEEGSGEEEAEGLHGRVREERMGWEGWLRGGIGASVGRGSEFPGCLM